MSFEGMFFPRLRQRIVARPQVSERQRSCVNDEVILVANYSHKTLPAAVFYNFITRNSRQCLHCYFSYLSLTV